MRRALLSLAVLAMALAAPAAAQPRSAADQEARRTAEAVIAKLDAAYNRHDAAAVAALFTSDAVFLPPNPRPPQGPMISGRDKIAAYFAGVFPTLDRHSERVIEARSIGDSGVWYVSDVQLSGQSQVQGQTRSVQLNAHAGVVLIRDGGQWRISMAAANLGAQDRPNQATSQAPFPGMPARPR